MKQISARRWNLCLLILGFFATATAGPALLQSMHDLGLDRLYAEGGHEQQTVEETWDVIQIGDKRIGYSHSTLQRLRRDGRTIIRTHTETRMAMKRFGQKLTMQTTLSTEETEAGELLSFDFVLSNPPAGSTQTVGRVEGDLLRLQTTTAGTTRKKTLAWDRETKSPVYQDRLLRQSNWNPGDRRSFQVFLPEFNRVTTVTLDAFGPVVTRLLDGKQRQLLKVKVTQSVFPTMPIRAYLDENGVPLKTETDFLGQAMTTYTVERDEALNSIAGTELDIAANTLVRVVPMPRAHQSRKIVYRIHMPGNDPGAYLVDGGTQKVTRIDDETVELTVTSLEPPRQLKQAAVAPEYLASTQFLQCDDAQVAAHARQAAAGLNDPARVALRMERYVHEKLTEKNFSTALASAAEVADSLEGDCTEHAVLLAAMLRAKNIPSRIAVGLVYVEGRSSFGGHMWTEALLGDRWIPLDATLGRGGIGAGHIKLAQSSFADDAPAPISTFVPLLKVLGNMKIDVVRSE